MSVEWQDGLVNEVLPGFMTAESKGGKSQQRRQAGAASREKGKLFERRLDAAFAYYAEHGSAIIEKTPEPMRPTKSLGNGRFVAHFEKKAQADYKGVLKGGRTIIFEAKFTASDRLEQNRVGQNQTGYMERYSSLGARCFIVIGFSSGGVYRIPWKIWREMKDVFGRKYVKESDLGAYRVQEMKSGTLLLLD